MGRLSLPPWGSNPDEHLSKLRSQCLRILESHCPKVRKARPRNEWISESTWASICERKSLFGMRKQ
eukprot:4601461-Alexandrium_andersonii.AAC.1